MFITPAGQRTSLNQSITISPAQFSFLILAFFLLLISPSSSVSANIEIASARYWAGTEYTRLTLESGKFVKYTISTLDSPRRIVMDMENVSLSEVLENLSTKLKSQDPLVSALRVGRFSPRIVRLVVELKTDVMHKAFALDPVDQFGHRLVLDIHALKPISEAKGYGYGYEFDPLMALLQKDIKPVPAETRDTRKSLTNPVITAVGRKPVKKRTIIVAIDAGHGGKDPGAVGPKGTMEKNVTLAIAKKLKAKLDKEPGLRAVLIRSGDYFLSLADRRIRARQANADLFVSIHADAAPRREAHGASVYALSENGATSTTARWLAKKENAADLIGGIKLDNKDHYLKQTLIDLSINATIDDSIRMASSVLNEIGTVNHLHKKNVEQASFAVLKSPDIPSILIETAFISNHAEEVKLNSEAYQGRLTDAMATGLKRYFSSKPWQTRMEVARTQ